MTTAAAATDVHQHLWPEAFVAALGRRSVAPDVRRAGRGWVVRVPGEADGAFGPATHDPALRAAALAASGLDRALLCMSTPLGVEALPEDDARPLLGAWHDGVFAAGGAFGVWGALPVHGAQPQDVDALLSRGAIGISLPAALIAGRRSLERAAPVLSRLEARNAPLLVHPGPADPPRGNAAAATVGEPGWWPALNPYVHDMHTAWHAFVTHGRRQHPRLRVCFAMLAGLAPLHAERLAARGGPATAASDPGLFYDTSSYGPRALAAMAAVVGPDQLVTGSDRPVVDPPPDALPEGGCAPAAATANVQRLLQGRSA